MLWMCVLAAGAKRLATVKGKMNENNADLLQSAHFSNDSKPKPIGKSQWGQKNCCLTIIGFSILTHSSLSEWGLIKKLLKGCTVEL